jgi:hypothetical protein
MLMQIAARNVLQVVVFQLITSACIGDKALKLTENAERFSHLGV